VNGLETHFSALDWVFLLLENTFHLCFMCQLCVLGHPKYYILKIEMGLGDFEEE
jgi:hypothetical protein